MSACNHLLVCNLAIFLVILYNRRCPPCRWCLPAVFSSCPCCPRICAPCVAVLSSSCSLPSFCFLTGFTCRLHFALLTTLLFNVMVSSWPSSLFACLLAALLLSSGRQEPVSARCPPLVLLASPLLVVSLSCGGEPLSYPLSFKQVCGHGLVRALLLLYLSLPRPGPVLSRCPFPVGALLLSCLCSGCPLGVHLCHLLSSWCPLVPLLWCCFCFVCLFPFWSHCCCAVFCPSVVLLAQACLLSARAPTVNCLEKTPGAKLITYSSNVTTMFANMG